MKAEEFDQAFDRYLKERFKPFRDKERPADYGRDLAPNQEKTHFIQAFSIAPSPSGDLLAAITGNRKDYGDATSCSSRRRTGRLSIISPKGSTRITGSPTSRR